MDYEALKDQWNEVEDRDGVRLSWNVFPSTRMVCSNSQNSISPIFLIFFLTSYPGSFQACRPDRSALHPFEGEVRYIILAVRTSHLQATLSRSIKSFRVSVLSCLSYTM